MMKFPEEYIEKGEFELHSGGVSDKRYDVNSMLTNEGYSTEIISRVPFSRHYVGIVTGGAIIAFAVAKKNGSRCSFVKAGEFKGDRPGREYILIDDVSTTERSLRDAIKLAGSEPYKIFTVVDRREKKVLKLEAMFVV